jgi:dTDP-4-dehydrorhamnose reductase
MEAVRPDLVINAAAYTAVDRAECEPDLAFAVNRDGARAVAVAAAAVGAPVIQLSTDYVFDGAKASPYTEDDSPSPLGVYGRSKLEGERAERHLIVRSSWIYAPFGANFVRTMLGLAASRERLTIVNDQVGRPTYAPDIASTLLTIAGQIHTTGWRDSYAGITHLAGPDSTSWFGFAKIIMSESEARGGPSTVIAAIASAVYPTKAKRPANSRLDTDRLSAVFGLQLPPLKASIARCLDALLILE